MSHSRLILALIILLLLTPSLVRAENWPAWRGPRADGTSSEKNVPLKWSTTENIKWKVPLPAPGNSTPIVWENKIFLTQALEKGARRTVMCLDRSNGRTLWTKEVPGRADEPTHETNPQSSSSPVTDGQAVYAWQGSSGVVAYDLDGKELWKRDLGTFTHIWGYGSSPILYGDLLILNCGPGERAFVVALNKKTGEQVWQMAGVTGKADQFLGSWSSPYLARHQDRDLLLIGQPHALVGYDPAKGTELWRCRGLTDLVYSTTIVSEGVAVSMSGYHGRAMAVKLGGEGDVTETNRLWLTPEGTKEQQRIGSGVIVDGHIYMVNEPGVECIKLTTGESLWKKRLGTRNWTSLVLVEGKLMFLDGQGNTHLFAAKPVFEELGENKLNETTNGSHAISKGNVFIRTYQHLWCVGK